MNNFKVKLGIHAISNTFFITSPFLMQKIISQKQNTSLSDHEINKF